MEQSEIPENAVVVPNNKDEGKINPIQKRRKVGPMRVLKVALLKMRAAGSNKKTSTVVLDDDSKNGWKKVVGSMRPLHLQDDQSPRRSTKEISMLLPPPSPSESIGGCSDFVDEESYAPSPLSSAYASAEGLNELVQSDEEAAAEQKQQKNIDGDEKIDAKAEEFIAQFYQQMRLQRFNEVSRDYQERSQRSLG